MTTDLMPIPARVLRPGMTLTHDVFDAEGHLLFARGQLLPNSPLVHSLLVAGGGWMQVQDTPEYQRARALKLDTLRLQGASLSDIAKADAAFRLDNTLARVEPSPREAWLDLLLRLHQLLREPEPADFPTRLAALRDAALKRLHAAPDAALLLLIFESSQEFGDYSSRHALLTLLLADLVAQQLQLGAAQREALQGAALTMNYGAAEAHDRLAAQAEAATSAQRSAMGGHGERAAALLAARGIADADWLTAVRLHHDIGPGPLAPRSSGEQLARLLHRIDIYGARLSPRRSRRALNAAAAARAAYLDEQQQPDEAGAALLKTVGLYPPGSIVKLANGEVGLVCRRGFSANEPLVAALIGKSGSPLSQPVPRDTRLATQAIAACLAPAEMKLRVNLDALLKL